MESHTHKLARHRIPLQFHSDLYYPPTFTSVTEKFHSVFSPLKSVKIIIIATLYSIYPLFLSQTWMHSFKILEWLLKLTLDSCIVETLITCTDSFL